MAPTVRNLTDVLLDPTEDEPTVQQIAELFLRTSTTTFTNKTLADISNYIHADATHLKVTALENINVGQPVKFTSYNLGLNQIQVNLADNTTGVSIGLASETVLSGNDFTIITNGFLKGFDTSAYTDGQILYLNGPGQLTHTEPITGIAQPIAFVVKSAGGSNGSLMVNASYPKQDAADVRYEGEHSVYDRLSVMPNRNKFINGGFDVWQDGTSFSGINTHTYTADQWNVIGTDVSVTMDASIVPQGIAIHMAGTTIDNIKQPIELKDTAEYAVGTTHTLSFWAWQSGGTGNATYDVIFRDAIGSTANEVEVVPAGTILGEISGWTKFVATFTIPTAQAGSNTQMLVIIRPPLQATVFKIAQAQLEEGSIATLFEQRKKGHEIALCKRFFQKFTLSNGYKPDMASTYAECHYIQYPVKMRTTPTPDESDMTYTNCVKADISIDDSRYQLRVDPSGEFRVYGTISLAARL